MCLASSVAMWCVCGIISGCFSSFDSSAEERWRPTQSRPSLSTTGLSFFNVFGLGCDCLSPTNVWIPPWRLCAGQHGWSQLWAHLCWACLWNISILSFLFGWLSFEGYSNMNKPGGSVLQLEHRSKEDSDALVAKVVTSGCISSSALGEEIWFRCLCYFVLLKPSCPSSRKAPRSSEEG